MLSFTVVLLSFWNRKNMKTALFLILFDDTMTYTKLMTQFIDRCVVVIGIRCNRTALLYKRLSSVMNRVADSHPEKQGSKPGRASLFFYFFLMDPF